MLKKTLGSIRRFLADEDGPTAIEYVFMVTLIVILCLIAINTVGKITKESFDSSLDSITNATTP